ncbi:MAG: stage II sporulation protein R [Oscillospiraceae bacterium]|nr:stage II sporulation protein R [Oscillospiraceae bacterium]
MLKRFEFAVLIGVIFAVAMSSIVAFAGESARIRDEVLRLHIVPNSDSESDQALKLAVRDAVLAERPELFAGGTTRDEARELAALQLYEIERTAQAEVALRGHDYPVSAEVVNMHFATRHYEGFILPAGRYYAIRLTIGQGQGENWWCIMFPPMCIPAASQETHPLEEQLAGLGQTPLYRPGFAVVEIVEGLRNRWQSQAL